MLLLIREGKDQFTVAGVVSIEVRETPSRTIITPKFANGEQTGTVDLTAATVELLPEPK